MFPPDPTCYDDEDFTKHSDMKLDLHKAIIALPTRQRIAVFKWLRDEKLTTAEHNALYHGKKNLRKWLK